MKDNKKYLDKVVEFLVRDTKIDYDQKRIQYPFYPPFHYLTPSPLFLFPSTLSKYCIDVYGLTDQEIEYVWVKYKDIIKDKI